ncbi:MAG: hypothetical protein U0793_19895 [Gemmataceae bacterium]
MRARTAFLIALLTLSLGRSTQAQEVMPRPVSPELLPAPRTGGGPDSAPTHIYASDSGHGGLSDWITYRHRSCWSNDWDPHVVTELYLRSGVDFPFPGDVLGRILSPGWSITGGGKAIFFDKSYTRAWFADISLGNTFNESNNAAPFNPITLVPGQVGRVRDYNRTCVGLGLGREWYLMGDGSHCNGPSCASASTAAAAGGPPPSPSIPSSTPATSSAPFTSAWKPTTNGPCSALRARSCSASAPNGTTPGATSWNSAATCRT